ncbi:MAG: cupin domain-containing protein [Planctomycetes bacterium]|nr:cupin domain-containing protein [Planctomycetota bacterium]
MAIDEEKTLADWKERGFVQSNTYADGPGKSWLGYVHAADGVVMAVEGELELEMVGERKRMTPGEEVLIKRHVLHSVRNVGDGECRWLSAYGKS